MLFFFLAIASATSYIIVEGTNSTNGTKSWQLHSVECPDRTNTICYTTSTNPRCNFYDHDGATCWVIEVECDDWDSDCHAKEVCSTITGEVCEWRTYDCLRGNGFDGSYWTTTPSSLTINFALGYDFGARALNGYGNICICDADMFSYYGLYDGHWGCGRGHWYTEPLLITAPPTTKPTISMSPSSSPSDQPTTQQPTSTPTPIVPSVSPSRLPTTNILATHYPSASPSSPPSKTPSLSPSKSPTTQVPSLNPSIVPSMSPSISPTAQLQPSQLPSTSPSLSPTTQVLTSNPWIPTTQVSEEDGKSVDFIILVATAGAFVGCVLCGIILVIIGCKLKNSEMKKQEIRATINKEYSTNDTL